MRAPHPREQYLAETFVVDDDLASEIRAALREDGKDGIQIGSSEARILRFLARLIGAKKIVEIGTLYGYSTLNLARALPEDGRLWTIDNRAEHHARAREFLSRDATVWPRVSLITADAVKALPEIAAEGPFDMVFIDADKGAYCEYLTWAERHLRPGGLVVGDNTLLFGAVYEPKLAGSARGRALEVMREFNRRLADQSRFNSCLIPTSEGLAVGQLL